MSRNQYRARSKKVQKLGRDGLVEQDRATGQEKRISQRAVDVSFGPERQQDQAAGRASSKRTPTQGKRRKQSRPVPPPKPDTPAVVDVLDAPEDNPTIRQANDVPATAPPQRTGDTSSNKRPQQQRANRLNSDAPTQPKMEDGVGGGRLQFELDRGPPPDTPDPAECGPIVPRGTDDIHLRERPPDRYTPSTSHRQTERSGPLRFEPQHSSVPSTPNFQSPQNLNQGTVLPGQHGGEDRVSMEATSTGRSGGHLRFELKDNPDTSSTPAIANAQSPQTFKQKTVRPSQHGGADRAPTDSPSPSKRGGHLRFEPEQKSPHTVFDTRIQQTDAGADNASVETHPHESTSTQQPASDPAAGLTRRQQKRYEKAERRVLKSGRRLEKAQAKLPTHRRARLEKEYDANTGKVRHRLRFETEVEPEVIKPTLPAQVGHTVKMAAVMKFHGKLREAERDNTAVQAAHKVEFAAEQGVGRVLRWNKQRLRSKPYRAVRRAERRLRTDQTKLAWQTALRDNPELRQKSALAKWVQKQKIKRKYAQAAREAQKTTQHTQEAITITGKIIRAVQQYATAHKSVLLIVAMLVLVISFFSAGLASCTAMLSGVQSSFFSATYLADEQEICNSELYFTELETDLQLDISSTEANYPGYDEYRYNIGEISHNPYELMSYLSASCGVFTYEQVRPELERLFGEKYQLARTPITEIRYDDNGQPYEWKVLQTTLTVGRLSDTIAASLTPGEQTERYQAYMEGCGNRQAYGNPFDFPWLSYVSSGYGWRVHPITGGKDLHRGVDIAAAQGTAIKAIQDGWVVSAGNMGSYGLCVVIEDDQGYQSRFAHCSSLNVSVGQEVKRGDVIGAVGSTGNSTGPHLHLEVMLNGEYLNPYYFVETGGSGETTGPVIPDYSGEPMGSDRFQAMLAEAEKYLGYPYVWGGTNPTTSFDCSGYVSWVINHSGWNYGRLGVMGLEDVCTPVSAADAQPGDLVFFIGTYDAPYPNRPTHVGIYVGNGRMIHCGDPISYANLNSPYWVNHFYGYGRLPEP